MKSARRKEYSSKVALRNGTPYGSDSSLSREFTGSKLYINIQNNNYSGSKSILLNKNGNHRS